MGGWWKFWGCKGLVLAGWSGRGSTTPPLLSLLLLWLLILLLLLLFCLGIWSCPKYRSRRHVGVYDFCLHVRFIVWGLASVCSYPLSAFSLLFIQCLPSVPIFLAHQDTHTHAHAHAHTHTSCQSSWTMGSKSIGCNVHISLFFFTFTNCIIWINEWWFHWLNQKFIWGHLLRTTCQVKSRLLFPWHRD